MKITAAVITYNEERNIERALNSLSWADEIVVVDSESTDATRAIAERLGARVVVNKWPGFAEQKQLAVDSATHDVIFSLDADEEVSAALRDQIVGLKDGGLASSGYTMPRLSVYMGREIRHGGWYPDRQLRLFDRRKAHWKPVMIHESVELEAGEKPGVLTGDILHYSVESPAHHHEMIGSRYAPLAAKQMFETGRRTNSLRTIIAGPAAFIRSYILKGGFLDGFPGYCIAKFAAHHAFLKHTLLLEMQNPEN